MPTWADRLRATAAASNATSLVAEGEALFEAMQRSDSSPLCCNADDDERALNNDAMTSASPPLKPQRRTSTLARIDVGQWIELLSYLSYRDICSVGLTCRGLWGLHLVDWIWYWQECFLRRDLWLARGQPDLAACAQDEVAPVRPSNVTGRGNAATSGPPAARYYQFKTLKVLAAKDLRREWDFKELTARRFRGSRMQVQMENNPDLQRDGVMTRSLTLIGAGRLLKAELRIFDVGRPNNNTLSLRPEQLLGACDELRANFDGQLPLIDTTEQQEDQKMLMYLLVGLSARQAGDNLLQTLGPRIRLLEISRDEANQFAQQELASRRSEYSNLLDDFVIDPPSTRYFIGPELCNGRRVGMVVVDCLRLLVVTDIEQ